MTDLLSTVAPEADGHSAYEFVKAWHGGAHIDSLIAINQMRGSVATMVKTVAVPLGSLLDVLENGDLDELVYEGGTMWNLYHSAGFLARKPDSKRRSGKTNISGVPGIWLDLDVKPGCFDNEDSAIDFAMNLPVRPTILVATGTGGVQAYWKAATLLLPDEAEALCVRWWQYASEICPVTIDKIQNRDRILRLPGSIRWPKNDDESPSLVRLLDTSGPLIERSEIYSVTEGVHQRAEERRAAARSSVQQTRGLAATTIHSMNRWQVLEMITMLEDEFNERYSWESILLPYGWTIIGSDYDGRTIWSRPGGNYRKSATTDWVESPHVMSLFSDSEDTGLRRLADAEVPLTKYRVYVELTWHGDEAGFVTSWIKQLEDEGKVE